MRETSVMAEYSREMQTAPRRFERHAPSRNPPFGRHAASDSDNRRNGIGSWAFLTLDRSDACHQLGNSAPGLKRDFKVDEVRQTSILAGVGVFVAVVNAGSLSNAANRLGISPHRQQPGDDRFRGALRHVTHPLFREVLATGRADCCELVDEMVAASAKLRQKTEASAILAMIPA